MNSFKPATSQRPTSPPDGRALPGETEAAYLLRQQAQARAGMVEALGGIRRCVGSSLDPRPWVRKHPWLALAAAGGGGVLAANLVSAARDSQAFQAIARQAGMVIGGLLRDLAEAGASAAANAVREGLANQGREAGGSGESGSKGPRAA
jgi:hypothetical protein